MKRTSLFLFFFLIFPFVFLETNLWALGDSEDTVKDNFVPEKKLQVLTKTILVAENL